MTNLLEIIGRESGTTEENREADYRASRVAEFWVEDGVLWIVEGCDGYFSADLDHAEVGRLIDWLQNVKDELPHD